MVGVVFAFLGYPGWYFPVIFWAAVGVQVLLVVAHAVRPKYRRLYGWKAPIRSLQHAIVGSLLLQIYMWGIFILLTTPLWWVARLLSTLTGVSATAIFLVVLGAIYGSVLVWGFGRGLVNRRFAARLETDGRAPQKPKRVAVVGAGMAGLVATKELVEEGHEVVVFERSEGPGGVWATTKDRGGVAWDSTLTSSGALNSTFSDDPFPVYHPENGDTPHHFTREQFAGLLSSFESRYDVFGDRLRVCCEVVAMDRSTDSAGGWHLTILDTDTNERSVEALMLSRCAPV